MQTRYLYFLLGAVSVVFFTTAIAYLLIQNRQLAATVGKMERAAPTPFPARDNSQGYQPPPTLPPTVSLPTKALQQKQEKKPVIVIESEGSIPAGDKSELEKKVIDPFRDYYEDLTSEYWLVSFTIGPNTNPSKTTYPYSAKAIFSNGVVSSFLIERKGTGLAWWFPDCMGPCPFSDDFKSKYPEIVAITKP